MQVIYQNNYERKREGRKSVPIREVQVICNKKEAKQIRQSFEEEYSKVEMHPFEVYEDRYYPELLPIEFYKGWKFYIWLNSKITKEENKA